MLMRSILRIIPFVSIVMSGIACAHDIWLRPERFVLSQGDTLIVHQLAGDELENAIQRPGSAVEIPVLRRMTPRFELYTPTGSVDLLRELPDERAQPELKPVLKRKLDVEGLALVVMEHDFIHTEHSNEEFLEYLQHEEFKAEAFQNPMGSRSRQRERYARTLKSLVQAGAFPSGEQYRQVLGKNVELVLLQNPYLLDPGDQLEVQVLFRGEPLGDKLVMAYNGDEQGRVSKFRARTNADGIARFKLKREGFWLLRLVHLLPCSEGTETGCAFADWESYWTSYSFMVD